MEDKANGLSHNYIIHPGETLRELIDDNDISINEVADKTETSLKYLNDVLDCLKPISLDLSKKLEAALGIEKSFWINLQANYDKEISDLEN